MLDAVHARMPFETRVAVEEEKRACASTATAHGLRSLQCRTDRQVRRGREPPERLQRNIVRIALDTGRNTGGDTGRATE